MSTKAAPTRQVHPWLCVVLLATIACGRQKSTDSEPIGTNSIPQMPMPMPGQAMISGLVSDDAGQPVAGATVRVAETDQSATTDATGAYQIMVPSDSTVTLATSATGFATTFRESMIIASGATVSGLDVMLMAPATVTAFNSMSSIAMATTRGLMAIRLHSMGPGCATTGAHLTIWPPEAGTLLYSRPATAGGLDQPDPTVDGVQDGATVHAWLVAAVSPGSLLQINVQQAGCQQIPESPSIDGVVFPGQRRAVPQGLTQVDLFLNQVQ
jgi:hypothetical protein